MNNDTVQGYILASKDNLRIAVAVSDAWAEAGPKLVSNFFKRLESRLKKTLTGWQFDRWNCYLNDSEAGFDFWKQAWKGEYYITTEFWKRGGEGSYGVARDADKEYIKKRPHCDELLAAVKKHYPNASSRKWWEAEIAWQSPAADWQQPEVLWRMHTDDKFLEEVAEQLLNVARIAETPVDRFVERLARRK
jgi:hypothetical protein